MLGLHSFDIGKKEVLKRLDDFEEFCLGRKHLSPEKIKALNEDLSIGAMIHIGKYRFEKVEGETHVVWVSPDHDEHDLGPLGQLSVHSCPGFHRSRSLALGHEHVESNAQIAVPESRAHMSMVTMKDGSIGYGPNYKIALRNAALKMHLKGAFARANPSGLWKFFYGNA